MMEKAWRAKIEVRERKMFTSWTFDRPKRMKRAHVMLLHGVCEYSASFSREYLCVFIRCAILTLTFPECRDMLLQDWPSTIFVQEKRNLNQERPTMTSCMVSKVNLEMALLLTLFLWDVVILLSSPFRINCVLLVVWICRHARQRLSLSTPCDQHGDK
jgi:hypothetical protein